MAAITVSPADVAAVTGSTVTEAQVTYALGLVAAATGLDLGELPEKIKARDLANLRLAVIWQALTPVLTAGEPTPSTVASVSANGASVTYRGEAGDETDWGLSQIAALYLGRLSWRRRAGGIRTTHVTPDALYRARPQDLIYDDGPPAWVPMGVQS